jgi:cold shock CspA family protein
MTDTQDTRYIGIVKWFNNKSGYGFITLTPPDGAETRDIFVHHSAITHKGDNMDCYRYLILGEYVEFSIFCPKNSTYDEQCSNVTGIYNGKLMYQSKTESTLSQTRSVTQHAPTKKNTD